MRNKIVVKKRNLQKKRIFFTKMLVYMKKKQYLCNQIGFLRMGSIGSVIISLTKKKVL